MSKLVRIKSVKIGLFDPYLDTLGGGEKYILTAASCLSKNHDIFVFWDENSILARAHERFGIDVNNLKTTKNIFSGSVSFIDRLKFSSSFDAIFYLSDGSIPLLLSKKLFLHFQFPVEWVKPSLIDRIKLLRVNKVICNSSFTKKYIDRKFNLSSLLIYPPSSGETKIESIKKENIILTVGRLQLFLDGSTFKKQEIMISMFRQMIDSGLKGWKLIVVVSFQDNEKKETDFLKKMIKNYPIEIKENVSSSELSKLYGKSMIYWHASGFGENLGTSPEKAEHFGIATVQAMEQGSVPIVFNGGGQTEIINDGQTGFLWTSEEECIKKSRVLINNKKTWKRMSEKASMRARDFNLDSFRKKITDLFQ